MSRRTDEGGGRGKGDEAGGKRGRGMRDEEERGRGLACRESIRPKNMSEGPRALLKSSSCPTRVANEASGLAPRCREKCSTSGTCRSPSPRALPTSAFHHNDAGTRILASTGTGAAPLLRHAVGSGTVELERS